MGAVILRGQLALRVEAARAALAQARGRLEADQAAVATREEEVQRGNQGTELEGVRLQYERSSAQRTAGASNGRHVLFYNVSGAIHAR